MGCLEGELSRPGSLPPRHLRRADGIRSLQEASSSHFGTTPTAMLLRQRLEQARAGLRRGKALAVHLPVQATLSAAGLVYRSRNPALPRA
ncbi:helix-turn-helix transcriptional regulator [Lichenicoccus roseus]|uniref:Uncharacterized protein n=1 Tax=Lichenicoccus roseus TaxID=2683649 RepID=A0A5R9J542_9PROT|nr:hypothetical protein [Lichenicoccus roseus]TLU71627.1 hypothetical protein FE263_14205 [Lichenicoccus roseus]